MRFHADALCSFWAMMAIVMQNTAVCRVSEASLRTVRALRRPQRALQRPLRHAQSLPFPVSLIGRKAQRIPFSTICSACRFHAFCRAERWLARPFMRVPRPSSPVDGRQRLSARSFCLRGECQDFCVWGGYSRGSPTRLPFVFEMQYARPDAIAGAKVEGPARSAGGSSLAPAIARREVAGALAREV